MKRKMIAGILGVLSGLAAAAEPALTPGAPEAIEFKFLFEPGRTASQRVVSTTVGSMAVPLPGPLSDMKFSQVYEQTLHSTCRKINPDKSAVFDLTIGDVVMRMSIGGFKIEYDSRTFDPSTVDDMTARIGKIFEAVTGVNFSVTLSETGQPLEVKGLADSMKRAVEKMSAEPQAAGFKEFFQQFADLMDDDSMNEQMRSFYRMSPTHKGPIRIGDKWEQTWSMKMPMVGGEFEGKGEYELKGIEELKGRKCARIAVKESFRMRPTGKGGPAGKNDSPMSKVLANMQFELSTSGGEGEAYIDYQRGELVQLRQTQNMSMTMKIPGPDVEGGTAVEMPPFTMKMRNSVSVDLVDNSAPAKPARKPAATPTREKAEKSEETR